MSPWLTHFCDRARPQPWIWESISKMSAAQRLSSILSEGKLRGFSTYSGGDPAVCLTEATINGLNFLVNKRNYGPWGLVFDRQSVYDAGGGPVWYARSDEYYQLRNVVNTRLRSWLVRLEPGRSDWLEEREWRIPVTGSAGSEWAVWLGTLQLRAVLVGDQRWTTTGLPCWWWNPSTREFEEQPVRQLS